MSQKQHDRRIDYLEFSVPDVGRAKQFYTEVFGWAFTDYGPDYTSFADGRIGGGFSKGDAGAGGGPLVVVYAIDLEQMQAAVTGAGGTISKETFDFPGGRRFHFRDPFGHELAIWSEG